MKHDTPLAGETGIATAEGGDPPLNRHLLAHGSEVIRPFFQALGTLRDTVLEQARGDDAAMNSKLTALAAKIDGFEASVTFLGQVKAGKTALVNVLSGNIGLLPMDVNPWTSVVTSLHLNARNASKETRARFRFFDHGEWDRIVHGGGRFGELAERAGADDDIHRLREQIEELRETARRRLSGNFETFLGKTHKYGYVDRELIERYACLGDPDEIGLNPKSQQGRFSDITKAVDVWLDRPEIGGSYLLRDTPGVNDTFLVREQITIQALRSSKICVVVLSAHEALNTTDLALLRLISNYESRQVVLFVNRIDELPQPSQQVGEIRDSITKTLTGYGRLRDVSVIFGSAAWAEMALCGDGPGLDEDAGAALDDWRSNSGITPEADQMAFLWKLSGIPELMQAINERIVERSGARHLKAVRAAWDNIASAIAARQALVARREIAERLAQMNPDRLRGDLDALTLRARQKLEETLTRLEGELSPALDHVRDDYVTRATAALIEHLHSDTGEDRWSFNSSGLRLVLRTTYDRFSARARAQVESVFFGAASNFSGLYPGTLGLEIEGFRIEPPQVPRAPPPVVLGKTIAIDLGSSWWKRWWQRRKDPQSIAAEYCDLLDAEIGSIVDDLREHQLSETFTGIRRIFDEFLAEQTGAVLDLLARARAHTPSEEGQGGERGFAAVISGVPGSLVVRDAPEYAPSDEGSCDSSELRKSAGGYR